MHSNVAGPRFINREPPPASHDSRSVLVLPGHPVPQLVQGIKGAVRQAAHATRSSPEGFSHAPRVSPVGRTSYGGPKVWPPPPNRLDGITVADAPAIQERTAGPSARREAREQHALRRFERAAATAAQPHQPSRGAIMILGGRVWATAWNGAWLDAQGSFWTAALWTATTRTGHQHWMR